MGQITGSACMITDNLKLIVPVIRNFSSFRMNRDMVGYSLESPIGPFPLKDIAEYAAATKDNNPLYQADNPFVPPFFISRVVYPYINKIMIHRDLKLNLLRLVHANQTLTWTRQIKADEVLEMKVLVKSIENTPAGEMIEIAGQLLSGKKVIVESTTGLIIRSKEKQAISGNKAGRAREEKALKDLFSVEIQTEEGQQLRYARASNDHNFIHTSNMLAKAAGLPRTIMHGVCVLSMACSSMSEQILNGDNSKLKGISCRFSRPAFPGDKLVLTAYKPKDKNEIPFNVFSTSGKVVLKDGVFRFRK
jgi:acyl dehydratase